MPATSVIVCSKTPERLAAAREMYARLLPEAEFIAIENPRSLTWGYNRGIERAAGERLIFSHDDLEIVSEHLAEKLDKHLSEFDLIGVEGTSQLAHPCWSMVGRPHVHGRLGAWEPSDSSWWAVFLSNSLAPQRVEALDGIWMACYRALAERIRWDEANFDAFDLYDVDFSFRAHLAGYRVVVCPDISILHYGAAEYDQEWTRAARRFVEIHAQDMAVWNGQTPPWEGVGGLTREQARELLAQKDERPGE